VWTDVLNTRTVLNRYLDAIHSLPPLTGRRRLGRDGDGDWDWDWDWEMMMMMMMMERRFASRKRLF